MKLRFLEYGSVILAPLTVKHATEDYLSWVMGERERRYRGAKAMPIVMDDVLRYIGNSLGPDRVVLAVEAEGRHVGNIALYPVDWVHRIVELSILIGADHHRKGYGRDAIIALVKHAFDGMNMERVWCESPNPAFNKLVEGLGFRKEGVKRSAFFLDGGRTDVTCWGLLAHEKADFLVQAGKRAKGVAAHNPGQGVVVEFKGG